jgi:hypothetical protein
MGLWRSHWPKVDAKVAEQMKANPDADAWENTMKLMAEHFTREEWKRLRGASDGGYHSLGAARIIGPMAARGESALEARMRRLSGPRRANRTTEPRDDRSVAKSPNQTLHRTGGVLLGTARQ